MGFRAPCQTPTDPPDPSLPSLHRRSRTPPRAASRVLLQSSPPPPPPPRRYSFAPCAHPSLLRPLSLCPSSSVVREPRPPACYSRLSFLLRPLVSLCVQALVYLCPSLSFYRPDPRTTHAFSFSSSLFPFHSSSFLLTCIFLPLPVHRRILVNPCRLSFFLPYETASARGER